MTGELEPVTTVDVEIGSDVPMSWNAAWKLAQRISGTPFVPGALRGKPEHVLACILFGRELQLGPMQSLAQIHVIDGRPAAAPELMRALVARAGHRLDVVEASADQVVITGERADTGSTATVTWTMADAQRAGLAGRGAWKTYPRAMLLARATSEICRMLFSDVIAGLSYTPEEVQSISPTNEMTPIGVIQADSEQTPMGVDSDDAVVDWGELGWADRDEHDRHRDEVRSVMAEQDSETRARLLNMWRVEKLSWPLTAHELRLWLSAMAVEGIEMTTMVVTRDTESENLGSQSDPEMSPIGDTEAVPIDTTQTDTRVSAGGRARCTPETVAKIEAAAGRLGVEDHQVTELASAILGRDINDVAKLTRTSADKVLVELLDQVQRLDEDEARS